METKEEIKSILEEIRNCISYGDYYTVKELVNLELEKFEDEEEKRKRNK